MYSEEFTQQMKEKLEAEKQRVEEKIQKLTADEPEVDNPDWDDKGNDATEDILEEGLLANYKGILEKVNKALEKIEAGKYGVCERTEELIPEEVLKAVPWAEFCREPKHPKD